MNEYKLVAEKNIDQQIDLQRHMWFQWKVILFVVLVVVGILLK